MDNFLRTKIIEIIKIKRKEINKILTFIYFSNILLLWIRCLLVFSFTRFKRVKWV